MAQTVGIVGLGKLGLPAAITIALRGHAVKAFDIDPARMKFDALAAHELDTHKGGPLAAQLHDGLDLRFCGLAELVNDSDCVLVCVETPHGPLYEGVTRLPETRSDFGYDALISAVRAVAEVATRPVEIGVVSTVLPGTIRNLILPVAGAHTVIYCPQFIAMGTVAYDLRHPEFTLLGYGERKPAAVRAAFEDLRQTTAPTFEVRYESAELAKVTYNTFISAKVTIANLIQQLSHELGASSGEVFSVLRSADARLASPAYIGPGMGDGGPCHPRDNIALSWLARRLDLGSDLFSAIMEQRQNYIEWLCDTVVMLAEGRPVVLLGTAYKPGVPIQTGSSAVLMAGLLAERGLRATVVRDAGELAGADLPAGPAAYFLGCPEPEFLSMDLPAGSVIIDPWHRVQQRDSVTVVRIGDQE